jgi:hypothetical protein
MFKKILGFFKNKNDGVVQFGSEYALLVKNGRIIDFTDDEQYSFDLRVGIYHDTYRYLTAGFNQETQARNINRVLTYAQAAYELMLTKRFQVKTTKEYLNSQLSKDYQRVQQNFEVDKVKLPKGKSRDTFCINFLVRQTATPYIIIGRKPKGRITRAERIEAVKRHAKKWNKYTHL